MSPRTLMRSRLTSSGRMPECSEFDKVLKKSKQSWCELNCLKSEYPMPFCPKSTSMVDIWYETEVECNTDINNREICDYKCVTSTYCSPGGKEISPSDGSYLDKPIPERVTMCGESRRGYKLAAQKCPDKNFYTIHGLWVSPESSCTNCDPAAKFDLSSIDPKTVELMKLNWMSCDNLHTDEEFWEHEWTKHGTCMGLTQSQYFQLTLDIYSELKVSLQSSCISKDCYLCISNDSIRSSARNRFVCEDEQWQYLRN